VIMLHARETSNELTCQSKKNVDMFDPCSVIHDMKNPRKYEMMQKQSYKTRLYKH
jgi:hypothetical protein